MRVLLIDDDDDGRNRALQVLANTIQTKYEVHTADTYTGSLALIAKEIYDLYLVDSQIGMPERNGLKLIREARKAGCTAPIILLSQTENEQVTRQVLEAGALYWVNKNKFTSSDLENAVMTCRYASLKKIAQEKTEQVEQLQLQIRELADREKELIGLKSRLLMMALHEFRSPLTTIYSSAELISRYTRTEEQTNRTRHVERIKTCVNKFLLTLDDFRILDECNADKITVQNEALNVFSLCRQVAMEIEKNYTAGLVRYSHISSAVMAQLDARLLTFIVRQILLNAIKFSYGKQVVIFTSCIDNSSLKISIRDHGIGIPEEEQQFLFEPFFRASNSLNISGTGIGLCLVAAYVKKMQGQISVVSTKDKGAVFNLTFTGICNQ